MRAAAVALPLHPIVGCANIAYMVLEHPKEFGPVTQMIWIVAA